MGQTDSIGVFSVNGILDGLDARLLKLLRLDLDQIRDSGLQTRQKRSQRQIGSAHRQEHGCRSRGWVVPHATGEKAEETEGRVKRKVPLKRRSAWARKHLHSRCGRASDWWMKRSAAQQRGNRHRLRPWQNFIMRARFLPDATSDFLAAPRAPRSCSRCPHPSQATNRRSSVARWPGSRSRRLPRPRPRQRSRMQAPRRTRRSPGPMDSARAEAEETEEGDEAEAEGATVVVVLAEVARLTTMPH